MSKKSIFSVVLALILLFSFQSGSIAEKENDKKETSKSVSDKDSEKKVKEGEFPEIHTDTYFLADLSSGKVLEEKNVDEKIYPASTTKILTGIIALEKCDLKDKVVATEEAISPINNKHSNIGIRIGEEMTVENLIEGMLIGSANDAANVLAVHVSGNLKNFAKLMNEKAEEIGANNSNFVNAHGFHDDKHYTTIGDLALITRYAMQNEKFAEIVGKSKSQIPETNKYKEVRYLHNTNMMISSHKGSDYIYKNAIGIKTGHTDESGYCLVSAAEKDGTKLFAIIMGCEEKQHSFEDSKALLEYGFYNYKYITVGDVTDIVESVEIRNAKIGLTLSPKEEVNALLDKDVKKEDIEIIVEKRDEILAPVKKGDVLGRVEYRYKGESLGSVDLVAGNDVERSTIKHICNWIMDNLIFIFLGIIVIFAVFVYFKYLRTPKKRKRKRLKILNDEGMQRRKR